MPYLKLPKAVSNVLVVEMHRAANTLGSTVSFAHELRHNLLHCSTPAQVSTVVPITSDDAVLLVQHRLHAHHDGFLSVVQVAETSNELGFVCKIQRYFHSGKATQYLYKYEKLV